MKSAKAKPGTERRIRRHILQAATRLFLKQGFLSTRTREIAEYADVNEALIFYYFKSKQNLRWAVLEDLRLSNHVIETLDATIRSKLPDEELVAKLAEDMLRITEGNGNLLRLLLAPGLNKGVPSRSLLARFYREHLVKSYELIAKYIRARIRDGEFRRVDPSLASRAFFSLVCYHVIIQEFFGGKYTHTFPRKKVARVVSKIWLEGLRRR